MNFQKIDVAAALFLQLVPFVLVNLSQSRLHRMPIVNLTMASDTFGLDWIRFEMLSVLRWMNRDS